MEIKLAAERRSSASEQVRLETGIDEAMINCLVSTFYARAQDDEIIGPIFAARVDNWEAHIQTICAFWSSVILMSGRYKGQPMAKHLILPIDKKHFDRWLALFETTARDICPPIAAQLFIDRANRIAESMELGIAGAHHVLLRKGERYTAGEEIETIKSA